MIKKVTLNETESALVTGNGFEFTNNLQGYWKTKFECKTQDGEADLSLFKPFDSHCEYYYALHMQDYGCLRCKAGYSGTATHWAIDRCQTYDE